MTRKKQNLQNFTGRTQSIYDLEAFWTEAFSETFEPNTKRLLKMHKVPKFKQRHVTNW